MTKWQQTATTLNKIHDNVYNAPINIGAKFLFGLEFGSSFSIPYEKEGLKIESYVTMWELAHV
jgi:hypothetical protein